MNILDGSPIIEKINIQKNFLQTDYNIIIELVPEIGQKYSFEEYCHFWLIVNSRWFGLEIAGKYEICMVPFADMVNHRNNNTIKWKYDDMNEGFAMIAEEDHKIGDSVFSNYGQLLSNWEIFPVYGFVDEHEDS